MNMVNYKLDDCKLIDCNLLKFLDITIIDVSDILLQTSVILQPGEK